MRNPKLCEALTETSCVYRNEDGLHVTSSHHCRLSRRHKSPCKCRGCGRDFKTPKTKVSKGRYMPTPFGIYDLSRGKKWKGKPMKRIERRGWMYFYEGGRLVFDCNTVYGSVNFRKVED